MIYDKLANIGRYKGLNTNLDFAIDYIQSHDLKELSLGKNVLNGEQVFVNVMETSSAPVEERKYEVHHHYMDIQIDLEGVERVDTGDGRAMVTEDFNEASDCGSASCPDLAQCVLGEGNFIICMANEPHKPNIQVGDSTQLKKCVFKVRQD